MLDDGSDSIHHVNIDYQVRSVEAQLVEFAKLYTNGDKEHMDFEEFKMLKNERPPKRGLWNPQGNRGGGNGGRGRGRNGGRGRYGGFKREIPEEDPLVGANKQIQARIKAPIKEVCIRDTMHAKDSVKFHVGCTKPDCQHRHDVIPTGAGKLSPPDKKAVV